MTPPGDSTMNEAYLLIGGNIGNRSMYLLKAKEAIERVCGPISRESSIYETAAWGNEDQEAFLNQALKIVTPMDAQKLLNSILEIEENLGRIRKIKYGPRLIDIDILLFNNDIIDLNGLKIPHPEMHKRRFVLVPMNEIAGEIIHPVFKKTIEQLLSECKDPLKVYKYN